MNLLHKIILYVPIYTIISILIEIIFNYLIELVYNKFQIFNNNLFKSL